MIKKSTKNFKPRAHVHYVVIVVISAMLTLCYSIISHATLMYHASITSKKLCDKEPQSFSHCGSFDHLALQSLNNCRFVFLHLLADTLGILGLVVYRWKGLKIPLQQYITRPKKFIFIVAKGTMIFCSR